MPTNVMTKTFTLYLEIKLCKYRVLFVWYAVA